MNCDNVAQRRVMLLQTDERSGLVASIAEACAQRDISLELTTGPGHVLITFCAADADVASMTTSFQAIPGVSGVFPYTVRTPS